MLTAMRIRSAVTAPTIRGEIMLAVIVLTVLPVLLTTIYFFPRINDLVEERVTRYSEAVVLQVENSIHDVVDQAKIISQQMTFWAVTQDLLLPGVEQPQNLLPAVIGTQQFISNLTLSNKRLQFCHRFPFFSWNNQISSLEPNFVRW